MTVAAITYSRLRASDPDRWRATAMAWRHCAGLAEQWATALRETAARVAAAWTGTAASAAAARLDRLRRRALLVRLVCWAAEQALSQFAAALGRARDLLAGGRAIAARAGLTIDDTGTVVVPTRRSDPAAPLWSAFDAAGIDQAAREAAAEIGAALEIAATADEVTARRLIELCGGLTAPPAPAGPQREGVPAAYRDLANRIRQADGGDADARLTRR
jgi:hypothetical protein